MSISYKKQSLILREELKDYLNDRLVITDYCLYFKRIKKSWIGYSTKLIWVGWVFDQIDNNNLRLSIKVFTDNLYEYFTHLNLPHNKFSLILDVPPSKIEGLETVYILNEFNN